MSRTLKGLLLLFAAAVLVACATKASAIRAAEVPRVQRGGISFYADSLAGRPTASGEPYDPSAATCAHRRWPFGTTVKVTIAASGKSATCRVNDRGPFVSGRVLDVSRSLAEELDIVSAGVASGRIERL